MTRASLLYLSAALASIGCGGPSNPADASTDAPIVKPNPCANKPNYVFPDDPGTFPNGFSLAACGSFVDNGEKNVETDAARAAQFITPLPGLQVPSAPPYKFSWTAGMVMPGGSDGGAPASDAGSGQPTEGTGYVVYFIDAATSKELLRVHTTQTEFTPDDPSWAKITAAKSIQLKLYAAPFVGGVIAGNPVTSPQPRLFTIQ